MSHYPLPESLTQNSLSSWAWSYSNSMLCFYFCSFFFKVKSIMQRVAGADPSSCLLKICSLSLHWGNAVFVQVASLRNITSQGAYLEQSENIVVISYPLEVTGLEASTWPWPVRWETVRALMKNVPLLLKRGTRRKQSLSFLSLVICMPGCDTWNC